MNSLITNQLSRLLARVNYQASAIELVSYACSRKALILFLGTDETESISDCTQVVLTRDEVNAILKRSGVYDDLDWFVSADYVSRMEAAVFIKAYLLKSIRIPQLKVA